MKDGLKTAFSLFGYMIVAGIMCVVCYFSMKMLFNFMFTEEIGYTVMGTVGESEEKEELYTVIYDGGKTDEKDDKWNEYESKGYTLYKYAERDRLSTGENASMVIISQLVSLLFVGSFVFNTMIKRGYKDGNLARVGAKKPDPLKGLKITLLSCAPAIILYMIFACCALANSNGLLIEIYVLLNATFWPLLELVFMSTKSIGDVTVWQLIVLLLIQAIIPVVGMVSYYCGYKDYDFLSKILYKKKRKG